MIERKIKRDGEQFVVAISEDKMSATVTDEKGETATITANAGHSVPYSISYQKMYPVASLFSQAVNEAIRLIVDRREPGRSVDDMSQEMLDYVEGKDG